MVQVPLSQRRPEQISAVKGKHMATPAQILANQANSQKSAGPPPPQANKRLHKTASHTVSAPNPRTPTERILVRRMGQHDWLCGRALRLQNTCIFEDQHVMATQQFALYFALSNHPRTRLLQSPQRAPKTKRTKEKGANWLRIAKARTSRRHPRRKSAQPPHPRVPNQKNTLRTVTEARSIHPESSPGHQKMAA